MKRTVLISVLLCTAVSMSLTAGDGSAGYDHERNPFDDLNAAIETAGTQNKRILLEIGGEWCVWCHRLEAFIHENEAVKQALDENFVIVKVNYSKENPNEAFLSQYPEISGYPHAFILESDGSFLHSQNTEEWEGGQGYSAEHFLAFVKRWMPASASDHGSE